MRRGWWLGGPRCCPAMGMGWLAAAPDLSAPAGLKMRRRAVPSASSTGAAADKPPPAPPPAPLLPPSPPAERECSRRLALPPGVLLRDVCGVPAVGLGTRDCQLAGAAAACCCSGGALPVVWRADGLCMDKAGWGA